MKDKYSVTLKLNLLYFMILSYGLEKCVIPYVFIWIIAHLQFAINGRVHLLKYLYSLKGRKVVMRGGDRIFKIKRSPFSIRKSQNYAVNFATLFWCTFASGPLKFSVKWTCSSGIIPQEGSINNEISQNLFM